MINEIINQRWLTLARAEFKVEENPTQEQLQLKAEELKNKKILRDQARVTAKQKLIDLGLTEEEVNSIL
jgi:hypothetical protein